MRKPRRKAIAAISPIRAFCNVPTRHPPVAQAAFPCRIAKAKAEGKYRGRKPTARAKAAEVVRMKAEGVRPADIARRLRIGRASVYRVLRDAERSPEHRRRARPDVTGRGGLMIYASGPRLIPLVRSEPAM